MSAETGNRWGMSPMVIASGKDFDQWCNEYFAGDHQAAIWVIEQAIDVVQELMDGGTPPVYGMIMGMMLVSLSGASCDMDTTKLTQLVKDHATPTYDIARRLIQHRVNEMDEVRKRGSFAVRTQH